MTTMNNSERDLKKQEVEIRTKLAYVFIPIALIMAIVIIYQNNSVTLSKKKYEERKDVEFHGIVLRKKQDGDYPRASKYVILDPFRKIQIPNEIYSRIGIGDSVYKNKGQDSAYYRLSSGEILVEDQSKFLREKYLKLLKKKAIQ